MLDAVRELTVDGLAPTYDEIAAHLGLRSRGQVAGHLAALRRKGRIEYGRQSRSIRLIEDDQPVESEIAAASTLRLRAVIEDAADAMAAKIGQHGAADILARVLAKHRELARQEATGAKREVGKPHRYTRKPIATT